MAFKASKKREPLPPEPVGKGTALVPSAAIRIWYAKQLNWVAAEMVKQYREEIKTALNKDDVKKYFAMDDAAKDLKKPLDKLKKKWTSIWEGLAKKVSKSFVKKSDEHANASSWHSLSIAGIKAPVLAYNENVKNTLEAATDYNHTLITGIGEEIHEKIYNAVMLSLTSPNPENQGQPAIAQALTEVGISSKKRIQFITQDQTSKLFSSLTTERMEQNGIEEFEWMHSGAGKEPRKTHVDRDGKIFKINDPELWSGPKSDQGPPGWAIRCRCRARPII